MSLQTPLLAEDGNQEEPPSLSGGPEVPGAGESSALSRLIAESASPPFPPEETTTTTTTTATALHQQQQQRVYNKPSSLITALAGTLLCLQWGLVWGAFFSDTWLDSHLTVSLGWQQRYLPWLSPHTDVVIQSTSVFTLSSNIKNDKEYASLVGLWICSIILPCVFMIVCPVWMVTDYTLQWSPAMSINAKEERRKQQQSRMWLELTIRLALLVAIIILILDVAIGGIQLVWEDTDLQVTNQLRGSYLCFLMGCTCALLTVVVLRMPYLEHVNLLRYPASALTLHGTRQQQLSAETEDPPPAPATRAPPANAFRLPWLSSSRTTSTIDGDAAELEPFVDSADQPAAESSSINHRTTARPVHLKGWQKWTLFQTGLFSFAFWIPSLTLASFRVLYAGMVQDLVKTPGFSVYVWQLPGLIWNSGAQSGTPKWMLVTIFVILAILVVVVPIIAQLVGLTVWLVRSNSTKAKLRDILLLLHPMMCGIPFAFGILVTVPSFVDIGENLDKAVCSSIEKVVQNQCLISGGVRLAGCWFLVAQSIALEAFVFLTIRWSEPPKEYRNIVV